MEVPVAVRTCETCEYCEFEFEICQIDPDKPGDPPGGIAGPWGATCLQHSDEPSADERSELLRQAAAADA
jgi:hypothetical protein